MSRSAGFIRATLLCAAIAALAPIAAADPYEADPDLATRDDDYAAGKRAVEKKDWVEAACLFQRAEMRHPDHAGGPAGIAAKDQLPANFRLA